MGVRYDQPWGIENENKAWDRINKAAHLPRSNRSVPLALAALIRIAEKSHVCSFPT